MLEKCLEKPHNTLLTQVERYLSSHVKLVRKIHRLHQNNWRGTSKGITHTLYSWMLQTCSPTKRLQTLISGQNTWKHWGDTGVTWPSRLNLISGRFNCTFSWLHSDSPNIRMTSNQTIKITSFLLVSDGNRLQPNYNHTRQVWHSANALINTPGADLTILTVCSRSCTTHKHLSTDFSALLSSHIIFRGSLGNKQNT